MQNKQRRKVIAAIHVLLRRPKWHNEAFAKYDQKRLYAWAARQRAEVLKPRLRLMPESTESISDRIITLELYKPYIAKNTFIGVSVQCPSIT